MDRTVGIDLINRASLLREWEKYELGMMPPARMDYEGTAVIMDNALAEINRLNQRVAVLEMVIMEELEDCQHDANQMIVDEIHEKMSP